MREFVSRQRPARQHVHRVMRAQHDAVVSIFRPARDHLRIPVGNQDRERERAREAVRRVAAGYVLSVRRAR